MVHGAGSSRIIKPPSKAQSKRRLPVVRSKGGTSRSGKGKKRTAEGTDESGDGGDRREESEESEEDVAPQTRRRKKPRPADYAWEGTAGLSKRNGKGKQKEVAIEQVDDEEAEEQEPELVEDEEEENEELENDVSSQPDTIGDNN